MGADVCAKFRRSSPDALMGHLDTEEGKGGILHRAITLYLKYLYENYWDRVTVGVDHKGLHKRSTQQYEAAVSAEKKYYVQ